LIDIFLLYLVYSPAFKAGLFFCLGLIFGSFLTAVTYRVPRGLDWVSARSKCTACGHALGVLDLIPVFSWLFLRGKCRHCGVKISARYPLIELSTGLVFMVAACY
jgi:prepilin signal peptidase PulO-like enzyme (type II secretory pathway)